MKTLTYIASTTAALLITLANSTPAWPCTGFMAHDGQTVLVANNEDGPAGQAIFMRFVPPAGGDYGYFYFVYEMNPWYQGGMNDQGLFWDGFATPYHTIQDATGVTPFSTASMGDVMAVSATVDEAIATLRQYDLAPVLFLQYGQLFLADRTGDSAIFDGNFVTRPTGNYQVCTNFLHTNPGLGYYPCWRYATVTRMMEDGLPLTVDDFAALANTVHQGTLQTPIYTRFTTISDLVAGKFYLYYDLDYENYLEIDLAQELSQGTHEYNMADLFPPRLGPDAGQLDAAVYNDAAAQPDAGTNGGADDQCEEGCGCRTLGRTGSSPLQTRSPALLLVLVVLVGIVARRRVGRG